MDNKKPLVFSEMRPFLKIRIGKFYFEIGRVLQEGSAQDLMTYLEKVIKEKKDGRQTD